MGSKPQLAFITGNAGKWDEAHQILQPFGIDVIGWPLDLPEIQALDARAIIAAKLNTAWAIRGDHQHLIVEDTSLYFDGLNGLPGPLIKWFMQAMDLSKLYQLVASTGNLMAHAVTWVGYAKPDSQGLPDVQFFEGRIPGQLVSPSGEHGFGWDPIFLPSGYDQTFATMDPATKNQCSMRRLALHQLGEFLMPQTD